MRKVIAPEYVSPDGIMEELVVSYRSAGKEAEA